MVGVPSSVAVKTSYDAGGALILRYGTVVERLRLSVSTDDHEHQGSKEKREEKCRASKGTCAF